MNRAEILKNRQTVIAFLKDPAREKCIGVLEDPSNPNARCCLGHMCAVFGAERKTIEHDVYYDKEITTAPQIVIKSIGLHDRFGSGYKHFTYNNFIYSSLIQMNDSGNLTPQEIGAYLESVIEGGPDTPWKSLNEYLE